MSDSDTFLHLHNLQKLHTVENKTYLELHSKLSGVTLTHELGSNSTQHSPAFNRAMTMMSVIGKYATLKSYSSGDRVSVNNLPATLYIRHH